MLLCPTGRCNKCFVSIYWIHIQNATQICVCVSYPVKLFSPRMLSSSRIPTVRFARSSWRHACRRSPSPWWNTWITKPPWRWTRGIPSSWWCGVSPVSRSEVVGPWFLFVMPSLLLCFAPWPVCIGFWVRTFWIFIRTVANLSHGPLENAWSGGERISLNVKFLWGRGWSGVDRSVITV